MTILVLSFVGTNVLGTSGMAKVVPPVQGLHILRVNLGLHIWYIYIYNYIYICSYLYIYTY